MAGTIVANTLNTDTGVFSTNNAYNGIAKAWVNFDGTVATPTIRAAFNVGSITKNGTGDYTINFTTAMPSVNYSPCVSMGYVGTYMPYLFVNSSGTVVAPTTSNFLVGIIRYDANAFSDAAYINVSIFSS